MFQIEADKKIKTHFMFNNFPPPENRAGYDIIWKTTVERGRPQTAMLRRKRKRVFLCRITAAKNTDAHSEYLILFFFASKLIPSDLVKCLTAT